MGSSYWPLGLNPNKHGASCGPDPSPLLTVMTEEEKPLSTDPRCYDPGFQSLNNQMTLHR